MVCEGVVCEGVWYVKVCGALKVDARMETSLPLCKLLALV